MRPAPSVLWSIAFLVAADAATKSLARLFLQPYETPIGILPGLSLQLAFNPGISFGLLSTGRHTWLIVIALTGALLAGLVILLGRARSRRRAFPVALVISGAVSNLADRLVNGMVTDFIGIGLGERPLFVNNLADVWITTGIAALILVPALPSVLPSKSAG